MKINATARLLADQLATDGYRPTVEEDRIKVKIEGGEYWILLNNGQDDVFQVIYPSMWMQQGAEEETKVLRACNWATSNNKFAKAYAVGNAVHCLVTAIHDDWENFYRVFPRYISALKYAANLFSEKMVEA